MGLGFLGVSFVGLLGFTADFAPKVSLPVVDCRRAIARLPNALSLTPTMVGEEEGRSEAFGHRRVYYVPESERGRRKITFKDGLLQNRGTPFWTGYMRNGDPTEQIGLAVIGTDQELYASDENLYRPYDTSDDFHWFHHSSFLRGRRVLWAGGLIVPNGKLRHINRQAGHYFTGLYHLHYALEFFQSKGVDLSEVTVNLSIADKRPSRLRAIDFIGRIKPEDTEEKWIYWRIFLKPNSDAQKLAAAQELVDLGEPNRELRDYIRQSEDARLRQSLIGNRSVPNLFLLPNGMFY